MRNRRTAIATVALAGALVWPAASGAIGASPSPSPAREEPTDAVVVANAHVQEELVELGVAPQGGTIDVVSVGSRLPRLLRDPGFVDNAHRLQDALNNGDAGVLVGSDVAITDLLAVDVRPDGDVTVFTR